ncbi:MAG: hypothetical protein BGO10_09320 [Chlamydia sp. 32-24]|nr:MAG: hypothetical protein BGO10_09320 [Chlamydia sp. 32-24]
MFQLIKCHNEKSITFFEKSKTFLNQSLWSVITTICTLVFKFILPLWVFYPSLAFGVSTLATRLVVKIIQCYNPSACESMKWNTLRFVQKSPYTFITFFILPVALSIISPSIGVPVAIIIGSLRGILDEIEAKKNILTNNPHHFSIVSRLTVG